MMISRSNRLKEIGNYYFADKLKEIRKLLSDGIDVINLGIGSPDVSPDQKVISGLIEGVKHPKAHHYQPYRGIVELREEICKWYNDKYNVKHLNVNNVLPLMGSKEGVMHIAMTYLQDGDIALVPNPGYPAYKTASTIAGAEIQMYDLLEINGWLPLVEDLNPNAKLMWINYPHMPTGKKGSLTNLKEIIRFAKINNVLIVFDNPYSFIGSDTPFSIFQIEGALDVCIELNSLSKSHNMAGWRLGMMTGDELLINDVLKFKSNMDSGMFLPLQLAAIEALRLNNDWYVNLNKLYSLRRERIESIVRKLGANVGANQAGLFIWAKIPDKYNDGFEYSDYLLDKFQVFATPGGVFGSNGKDYIRFSLCVNGTIIDKLAIRLKV